MEMDVLIIFVVVVGVILILVFKVGASRTPPPPEGLANELQSVEVRHIVDGDTVIVFDSWNESWLRLDAIDCPEKDLG